MNLMEVFATEFSIPDDKRTKTREEQTAHGQQERTEMHKTLSSMLAAEEQVHVHDDSQGKHPIRQADPLGDEVCDHVTVSAFSVIVTDERSSLVTST